MSFASLSSITFAVIFVVFLVYFCCMAHRRRQIMRQLEQNPTHQTVIINRRAYRRNNFMNTPVYTIPMPMNVRYSEHTTVDANGLSRSVRGDGIIFYTVAPIEPDLPPTYDEAIILTSPNTINNNTTNSCQNSTAEPTAPPSPSGPLPQTSCNSSAENQRTI